MEDRIDLVDGAFWGRNPHAELAWLRANAPVWRDDRNGVWAISTHALVKEVERDTATFSSTGGIRPEHPGTGQMIDLDDPEHAKRRKLINKGFTMRRVQDQEAPIRTIVTQLIDAVCERGECDLVKDIAAWLPLIVIGDAMGIEPPDREQLLEWSDDLMVALGTRNEETLAKQMAAAQGWAQYMLKVMAARKEVPTDDLIGILVEAEVDGDRLGAAEIIAESLLILIGGDETTRHVISGGAYQLLAHPEQWEALRADPSLLPGAIEEMLRWVSPVKNMARTATRDVELAGQHIPRGEKVLLMYSSANRDETVFADPNTFDIRRTPNDHVAFGYGTHHCLGANLARLELKVLFEELLTRLPDLELVDLTEPAHRPANFVSGYETLPVRFTPTARAGG